MSRIDKDLAKIARQEWPAFAGSADLLLDGTGAYYYSDPAAGKYTRPQYLHARHVLGLDDGVMTEEEEKDYGPGRPPHPEDVVSTTQCRCAKVEIGDIGGNRTAEAFLRQATELLAERGKQYDQPSGERSMGKTIGAFNIIAGRDLTESEGWLIMSLLKRVRQYSGQGYHKDSAEDGVTYGALEAEALEASAERARELEK